MSRFCRQFTIRLLDVFFLHTIGYTGAYPEFSRIYIRTQERIGFFRRVTTAESKYLFCSYSNDKKKQRMSRSKNTTHERQETVKGR